MFPEPDSYEPTIEGALPTNNICSIFFNGTCRLESMDICSILHEVSVSGCTFTLCLGLVQTIGSSDANGHSLFSFKKHSSITTSYQFNCFLISFHVIIYSCSFSLP
ncbi:hypothetical protein S83_022209 [Arachis hypogaea]